MTTEQLFDSKHYVKNEMTFPSPKQLVEPFFAATGLDGEPVEVEIQGEVKNENEDETVNIAYPRFAVKIDFGPDDNLPGYTSNIGMIVALDVSKPIVKVYSGQSVQTCMNLCIFGADEIFTQDIFSDRLVMWNKVEDWKRLKNEQIAHYKEIDRLLNTTFLDSKAIDQKVGDLLRRGRNSIGMNNISNAVKMIDNPSSQYAVEADGTIILNKLYNALTYSIGGSVDLISRPNKTLSLAEILLN